MENNMWEQQYQKIKGVWGIEPEGTLVMYEELVPKGKILDLGIGEGRNVIRFASKGYEIEGVDLSPTALERCKKILDELKCEYKLHCTNMLDYSIKSNEYSLIITTWVLNFFKKSEGLKLIMGLQKGLIKGGILYIGVFSKKDPKYASLKDQNKEIEEDTFYIEEKGSYITYYNKDEILNLFSNEYEIICCREGYCLDFSHGSNHYHGDIELMMRKK